VDVILLFPGIFSIKTFNCRGLWATTIPGVLGALTGATISLFAVAMLVSFLIRGWPGVGVGIIVVIIEINLVASGQHLTRKEPREQPSLVANGTAKMGEPKTTPSAEMIPIPADQTVSVTPLAPKPTPSSTPEVTKPALVFTKMEYNPKKDSIIFTVTNQSDAIVTEFTWQPIFMRNSSNCIEFLNNYAESLRLEKPFSNDNESTKELAASLGALERKGFDNTLNGYPNGICLPVCPPPELIDCTNYYTEDRQLQVYNSNEYEKSTALVNIPPKTSYTVTFSLNPYRHVKIPLFYIKIFNEKSIPNK